MIQGLNGIKLITQILIGYW